MFEAEITAWINIELTTDFFVRCNVVVVIFLIKCGVVWRSAHTLDSAHLVKYTPDCEVDVKHIKRTNLRAKV